MYKLIDSIPVWGDPQENAVAQMSRCAKDTAYVALMADHHKGYALPIGGVAAYREKVSPSGIGFDIACGSKAVRLDIPAAEVRANISTIMDDIVAAIAFGVGRTNAEPVDHELFDDNAWKIPVAAELYDLARAQLGTVGSGNHFVDIFEDETARVWIGTHFGSRGMGHKLASHFVKAGGGRDGMDVDPVLLDEQSELGAEYIECMHLAGRYAYAGRDWVCNRVARLLGATVVEEVHNHHNFAWRETHFDEELWVVRKGATPAWPAQRGFIGGSMGDVSVIVEGTKAPCVEATTALYSTVHGAGRVMSRTKAAGKTRWRGGKRTRISEGCVSREMMDEWIGQMGVELRGAGVDESPHVYKRLPQVLEAHEPTITVLHTLTPLGVAMAPGG